MSGGHYSYAYVRVLEFAEQLRSNIYSKVVKDSALRREFAGHLYNVSLAMKAIEWNDSGDGDDQEEELIRICIQKQGENMREAEETK